MINMLHNKRGYAVLALTLVVLLAISLLAIVVTKTLVGEHKSSRYGYAEQQAQHAAIAGLEYGIKYSETNKSTITDGQVLTGTLANGSTYSVTLTFNGSNEDISLASVGTSVDGTITRTVVQRIKYVGTSYVSIDAAIRAVGYVALSGNAEIDNTEGNTSIASGHAQIAFSGNAGASSLTGSSDSGGLGPDVTLSDPSLTGLSGDQLATQIFGMTVDAMKSSADITYTYPSNHNYNSELHNLTNKTVVINQNGGTATINGNTDIGTPGNPVTIIIDGHVSISGNTELYGNIIASGSVSISGNTQIKGMVFSGQSIGLVALSGNTVIDGALASAGGVSGSGNLNINFDSNELINNAPGFGGYGKVPGTWKDN
jgi:hypothetical protein